VCNLAMTSGIKVRPQGARSWASVSVYKSQAFNVLNGVGATLNLFYKRFSLELGK
jgi:hypothetical protein